MKRDTIPFATFKRGFIDVPKGGYYPVHCSLDTVGEDPAMEIDLICEWRLADGKVMFVRVPYSSPEEFSALVRYVLDGSGYLAEAIREDVYGMIGKRTEGGGGK